MAAPPGPRAAARNGPFIMPFFMRYVVVYLVVAALLLAVVAYAGYAVGAGAWTWLAVAALFAWLFVYHPSMLWRDYRRVTRLVADVRGGKFDHRIHSDRVRDEVQSLAVEYAGVPRIVAVFLVPRVLTDDVIGLIAAQCSRSLSRA
jgi:Na+/alanine symporter